MSERDFSKGPGFETYEYTDRDTGEIFISPFAVAVFGIRQQKLGAGRVIGATNDDGWDSMPVIEIDDPQSPTGTTELLGAECWWMPLTEEVQEITDNLSKRPEDIMPVSVYIKSLDSTSN